MVDKEISFLKTVRAKYKRYSSHVLGFRHFSEGRDGLKPVQRRALWSAYKLGAVSMVKAEKTAAVAGHAFGHYHPHAEGSVSKAIVNMSQSSTLAPLVLGIGNFGSHDAPAAAPRYTSLFISPYALTMLDPHDLRVVPVDPTYDGKDQEPRYLPARVPHLLLAGCLSLAPGYNGKIPPCTPEWVVEALEAVASGRRLRVPREFAYRYGGRLKTIDPDWTKTGAGAATFDPEFALEAGQLVFTSLAPNLSLSALERRLEKFPGFAGAAKESASGTDAVRIVARVKRGTDVRSMAEHVRATCSVTDHLSLLHIRQYTDATGDVSYDPVIEGPGQFLAGWIKWRKSIISGSLKLRAEDARAEASRLDLMARAAERRRALLRILDESRDAADIRRRVVALMRCTPEQAAAVEQLSWTRLARLEIPPLRARQADLIKQSRQLMLDAQQPGKFVVSGAEAAVRQLAITNAAALEMRALTTSGGRRARGSRGTRSV